MIRRRGGCGVQERVEHVGDQRCDEVDDADDEGRARRREVLPLGRAVDELPDAVVVEDELDRDEAAEEIADLSRDDGDRGQEEFRRTWRRMTVRRGRALEDGGARVVGVEGLDRSGSRHAGDVAEEDEDEAECREEQVLHLGEEAGARRGLSRHWEDVEPDAEDHDPEHGPDELGDGSRREAAEGDDAVARLPLERRGNAADDRDQDDDQEGERASLAEFRSAGQRRSPTGRLNAYESPRSP